jgi:hypothetical protein
MNCSTAARLAISPVLLALACDRGAAQQTQKATPPAEIRRISPEELKTFLPPRLQGPNGPYTKAGGSDAGNAPPGNSP